MDEQTTPEREALEPEVEDKPKVKKKAAPSAKIQSKQQAARARAMEKLRNAGR